MGLTDSDSRYMDHAFAIGRRQRGRTWPNPAVGCVLVKDDTIVGRGWTARGGRPHAETRALAAAGERARDATAYVTLEPCAHQGQTQPCAEALIHAGVARVVSAMDDPDPRVAGAGHRRLAAAGVTVTTECLPERARTEHHGYLTRTRTGRPALTLKLALSLDGKVALTAGTPTPITGRRTQRFCHRLRSDHDAILVGRGTVQSDNPQLTARLPGIADQPVRIVLDSHRQLDPHRILLSTANEHPVWICHGAKCAPESDRPGVTSIACRLDSTGRIDSADALQQIGDRGITRLFCEGGPTVATSLLAAGLVDTVYVFIAGAVFGSAALPAVGTLAPILGGFTLQSVDRCGNDSICCWTRGSEGMGCT